MSLFPAQGRSRRGRFVSSVSAAGALLLAAGIAPGAMQNIGFVISEEVRDDGGALSAMPDVAGELLLTRSLGFRQEPAPIDPASLVIRAPHGFVMMSVVGDGRSGGGAGGGSGESEASRGYKGGTNFRGEEIRGATTRYFEDFESGTIGQEWAALDGINTHEALGTFADPTAGDGMILNVSTEPGRVYEIRLDLYMIPPPGSETIPGEVSVEDQTLGAGDDGDEDEKKEPDAFTITVDGRELTSLTPHALLKMAGPRAVPGQPLIRKVRVNFTSGYGIVEVRFRAPPGGPVAWGVDNVTIDLGLQDPVMGVFGTDRAFDPGIFGLLPPGSDLNGEIPGLPRSRYGRFQPFSDDPGRGGRGGGAPRSSVPEEDTDDEIPAPGTAAVLLAGLALTARRRRR